MTHNSTVSDLDRLNDVQKPFRIGAGQENSDPV